MFSYPSSYSPNPIEIPVVNGIQSARNYQMPNRSSVLLLDNNAPIVYMVMTDASGYKTIKSYKISEQTEDTTTLESLSDRITKIERMLNNEPDFNRSDKVNDANGSSKYEPNGNTSKLFSKQSNNERTNAND